MPFFPVNGDEWERQRRLLDQAFQVAQLEKVFPAMEAAKEAMLERLQQQLSDQGKKVNTGVKLI